MLCVLLCRVDQLTHCFSLFGACSFVCVFTTHPPTPSAPICSWYPPSVLPPPLCCTRYIAALGLDDRHKVALVKEAVIRNKHAGNFRYSCFTTCLVLQGLGLGRPTAC